MNKGFKNKYLALLYQKHSIEKHYTFFKCRIIKGLLRCEGWMQPAACQTSYRIRIDYTPNKPPSVYVMEPYIEPQPAIHMYKRGNLCLYYPSDMPWKDTVNIAKLFVFWTYEWLIHYELWQRTGFWEAESSPHFIDE